MSAESDNIRQALAEQLSGLDDSLGASTGDVELLSELQRGIGRLLAESGAAEGDIRRILQEHYDTGELRKETYQLVKSMLDRFVTEKLPTSPDVSATARPPAPASNDDLGRIEEPEADRFSSTAVIPNEPLRPETADDRVQVGSVLRDRFLLQERMSGGSMGVVYKALDRRLAEAGEASRWVAIKVLSPQLSKSGTALRALQQEASKGRCLTHPNIVRFVDLDRDDELYFIVMEWLEGRTLADILDSPDSQSISVDRAIDIVRQIGRALEYAHRCGIVHADIKPGNIMILPDGTAKLFDFGVARVMQAQRDEPDAVAVPGALTPAYSSMQVLTGEEPVPSDDVFSLGCLFYRLVAGFRVFGPRNAAEAAEEGMKPQRPKGLSDVQWNAVKKAISYSRVTRFGSMGEFMAALDNVGELPGPRPSAGPRSITLDPDERRFQPERSRGGRGWFVAFVLLVGLLGYAGYHFGLSDTVRAWLDELQSRTTLPPQRSPASRPVDDGPPEIAGFEEAAAPDEGGDTPATEEALAESVADDASSTRTGDGLLAGTDTGIGTDDLTEGGLSEEQDPELRDSFAEVSDAIAEPLPAADVEIALNGMSTENSPIRLSLMEGQPDLTIELFRVSSIDLPLEVRIEEVGHSGNRSPWASGQLQIANQGFVSFAAGQDSARTTIGMLDDPLREADQQSTLRFREVDSTISALAVVEVTLEDDDQRAFEARLPADTIGFAVSQIAVGERDPAAQIDILRFNPGNETLVVAYVIRDITAAEGEDYFSPGGVTLTFGPGQRTARILIPLVQDSVHEGDEAFTVELSNGDTIADRDVFQRIVVMIRDDDPAP